MELDLRYNLEITNKSKDIIHLKGSKTDYTKRNYLENLKFENQNNSYIIPTNADILIFKHNDVNNERIYAVNEEFSPFIFKKSCKDFLDAGYQSDGIYTINPNSIEGDEFQVYCDMTTNDGGWTLVWSHILNKANYPGINLLWESAISSKPIFDTGLSTDLVSFQVYTGLEWWGKITNKIDFEIRYSWATSGTTIDQEAIMVGNVGNTNNKFTLSLQSIILTKGTITPGIYSYHNNRAFTTYDRDNDSYSSNCANNYNQTPWWYGKCWSGSINGGGGESSHHDGAYWSGSSTTTDATNGTGGANGWIYIR